MKALVFERDVPRFAAAMTAGSLRPGSGARVGPLRLLDTDVPALPGPGWVHVKPRLAGICGSDLATIDGTSSRYFEPIVSFPFTMGHEVVADLEGTDGSQRVVLEPVLGCVTRGIDPPCAPCAAGDLGNCTNIAFGDLRPGLQSGFCCDTGGGWSTVMAAHRSQLHAVPADLSDEAAVLVEPAACAVHAARSIDGGNVAVIGAGTLGLLVIAALRQADRVGSILATAKYARQRAFARAFGADRVVEPDELARAVRSATGSFMLGDGSLGQLTGGISTVVDCIGSEASIAQALSVVAPGGEIVMVGMPGHTSLDLTPLWHRESRLRGCYAYDHDDFARATELVGAAELGRLVSATYPLSRYRDAIEHAASAGPRGSVKIAFDLRNERERNR